ncbi:MAG: hypothetical protein C0508_14055 [Cyanobacteria bacterium PR.023]|nr:hypothetical protein [Cyanobacteria bacterium PR.023]
MSINEYSEGTVASLSAVANYIESYSDSNSAATGAAVSTSSPLIIEPQELSPQARLDMYIAVAARAADLHVMETAMGMALRTIRAIKNASISSTMPTAAKLKTCETPILNLVLEFAAKSPEWRALIVQMMIENVATGSGHLSINRAKQVLKEIAKRAPFKNLVSELKIEAAPPPPDSFSSTPSRELSSTSSREPSSTSNREPSSASSREPSSSLIASKRSLAAIYLLGWLKHEKAIEPLVEAFEAANVEQQAAIVEMLQEHYSHKLPFYLKWRCANRQSPTPALQLLMHLLQFET